MPVEERVQLAASQRHRNAPSACQSVVDAFATLVGVHIVEVIGLEAVAAGVRPLSLAGGSDDVFLHINCSQTQASGRVELLVKGSDRSLAQAVISAARGALV